MLVFSAICPHPPLLLPSIGKENLSQVEKTVKAMKDLEEEFYASKPDAVVIISPHTSMIPDAFSINIADNFSGNLNEFGDFTNNFKFKSNTSFAHKLKERTEDQNFSANLTTIENLDHGILVPLYFLTKHTPDILLTPLGFSLLDLKTHFDFGRIISDEIHETNQRIALIASGDLSHRLTEGAPAGYSPEGKVFDKKIIELLQQKDAEGIISLDNELIEEAGECGLRSIIILLGVLNRKKYTPKILSYEGPFGVGYLVASFNLH